MLLLTLAVVPTMLIWLPFFARFKSFWTIPLPQQGMATVVANYDGPLYLAVANSPLPPNIILLTSLFFPS